MLPEFKHGGIGVKRLPGKPIDKQMRQWLSPIVHDTGNTAVSIDQEAKGNTPDHIVDGTVSRPHTTQWIRPGCTSHNNAKYALFGRKVFSHITHGKPDRSHAVIAFVRIQSIIAIESGPW